MSSNDSKSSGGTNWTLGLDKLTTPTLEFLGLKIRDTVRTYLNSKARERAAMRKFEREFFVRQSELLSYGADQYGLTFVGLEIELLDRAFARFEAVVTRIAEERAVDPIRALEVTFSGFARKELTLVSAHEVAIYHAAAALLDTLVTTYSAQATFHFCFIPSTVHRQHPLISDEELDAIMDVPETLEQIQKELEPPNHPLGDRIAMTLSRAYGIPWPPDEKTG